MPVVLKFTSLDELFYNTKSDKILINDINIFSEETRNLIDNIAMINYTSEHLSIIPSCECGEVKGTYFIGEICHKCKTHVKSSLEDSISFLVWCKRPEGVSKFISPFLLAILVNRYKYAKTSISIIPYLLQPHYKLTTKNKANDRELIGKLEFLLKEYNLKRGYNSFVDNFFTFIDMLESNFIKETKESKIFDFKTMLLENKDNIFSEYLPFPNKVIFASETNELGRFMDKNILIPLNSLRRLTGIDLRTQSSNIKQSKVAKSLIELADFYTKYFNTSFFKKTGLIRQHISSTRSHFTARAVITSLPSIHRYDEIHIPWTVACGLLREHILNRLFKRGYTFKQAISFLYYHSHIYSPILEEIFNEIIRDSGGGIPCLFNRNPSLHRGSIQKVYVTKVKSDPKDTTISFSFLITPAFNGDFDGDELNLYLLTTEKMLKHAHNFDSHHNILSLNGPNEFSNNIKLTKPVVATLANWFAKDD